MLLKLALWPHRFHFDQFVLVFSQDVQKMFVNILRCGNDCEKTEYRQRSDGISILTYRLGIYYLVRRYTTKPTVCACLLVKGLINLLL